MYVLLCEADYTAYKGEVFTPLCSIEFARCIVVGSCFSLDALHFLGRILHADVWPAGVKRHGFHAYWRRSRVVLGECEDW